MKREPGWYPDPWISGSLRWWDGDDWTPHWTRRPPEPRPQFPAAAAWPTVLGVIVTVVGARVVSTVLRDAFDVPDELYIAVFYSLVFGGLWTTCRHVSVRFGTGRPFADFGLSWRPSDVWRGLLILVAARVAQAIAISPWIGHLDRLTKFTEGLEHVSFLSFALFAVAALIGAPILEELTFRGALQRSLASRVGQGWAIAIQGALFGLYHVTPGLGGTNVPYAVSLMAAGWVLGWGAWQWRRLGPTSTAHLFFNALGVIALYAAR